MTKKTEIARALNAVLADTFVLYFKTHSFHWNVTGPHFKPLHELFMEQYTELWNATDEIAERIRILNEWAPVSWQSMAGDATLQEVGQLPDASGMVAQLATDNEEIIKTLDKALHLAESAEDNGTIDLVTARIGIHEKAAWMLRSHL